MSQLPTIHDVRDMLWTLTTRQLRALSAMSTAAGYDALIKIKYGVTSDPRLSTVTAVLKNIKAARRVK